MANKLDNLKPFEKGQSGNPKGRPKGAISSKTILSRFLSLVEKGVKNPVTGEFEDMTVAEVMNLSIIAKARKGDLSAYREILDRLEGKAQQSIDHTTGGEKISGVDYTKLSLETLKEINEASTRD
jgi:hypothetical protein